MSTQDYSPRDGAIIHKVSKAYEVSSQWTLAVSFNPAPLFEAANHLKTLEEKIEQEAKTTGEYGLSNDEFDQLRSSLREVFTTSQEAFNFLYPSRPKRAIFGFGGTILQYTLGVAKDSDVQDLATRVEFLESQDHEALNLLSDQLTIINETNIQAYKNKNQLEKLKSTTIDLAQAIDKIKNTTLSIEHRTKSTVHAFVMITTLKESALNLRFALSEFKESFQLLIQNQLHEYFLHPSHYLKALTRISSVLPHNLEFLYDTQRVNMYKWYQLVNVKVGITKKGIIHIFIEIPLMEKGVSYNIFEIIPFPAKINDNEKLFRILDLHQKFLVVSHDETAFLSIAEKKEISYKQIDSQTNIIEIDTPLYSSEKESCVFSLYKEMYKIVNNTCSFKITNNPQNMFVKIEKNVWLFIVFERTRVIWTCPSTINVKDFPKHIDKTGQLQITYPCSVRIGDRIIKSVYKGNSTSNESINFNFSVNPEMHLGLIDQHNNSTSITEEIQKILEGPNHHDLAGIKEGMKVHLLRGKLQKARTEINNRHHTWIKETSIFTTLSVLAGVAIIGAALAILIYRKVKNSETKLQESLTTPPMALVETIIQKVSRLGIPSKERMKAPPPSPPRTLAPSPKTIPIQETKDGYLRSITVASD